MILGYEITELIHEGLNSVIYRGVSESRRVILKVLKAEYPSLEQVARLKHEYSIIESLDLPTVVRAISLENYQNSVVLVLSDFGGISLKHYLENHQLSLVSFLSIAVQLAQALLSLHQHHIIHKDVKPANIIINPHTHEVKLTDFSIASRLDKETLQIVNPDQLEGTLAYISPEQTGRMNRSLDYRSDFYSLGVTFYEMLTGNLPFQSDDALNIIYSHIALSAPSLQTNSNVPPVLAAIIEKLMAKNAEDRYQSANGLLKDLQCCLDEAKSTGAIRDFALGENDKTAQLLFCEKLYGREQEVKTLLAAFERTTKEDKKTNRSEVVLVSGYSGIGKSSLVHEIHKPIVLQRGFFVFGKFDQFHRTVPYAAFTQAFKSLIQQLLTLGTQELRVWKDKLLVALFPNAQVIIDIIPELKLIIGDVEAPVAALSFTEAQNRFNQVFRAFVDVFALKEHPLVVFIDDLQWADIASLKLMQLLLNISDSQYLLFIGAYRDNEVSSTHVLMQTVEDIQKAGTTVNYITLKPLALECVQQLVSDALQEPLTTHHQELALLLFNQTSGNPFFLTQMLKTLYQEELLRFDFACECWSWELEQIQSAGIINLGVVELMSSNISKLPSTTQSALQFAACIGACFELHILAAVLDLSISELLNTLWIAIQQGFILPITSSSKLSLLMANSSDAYDSKLEFKFLHDRVQQAAYCLIPDNQKPTIHLKIGQLLLNTSAHKLEDNILDTVNHLNIAVDLLTASEKEQLIQLNIKASQKAKAANAYDTAVRNLNFNSNLLPVNTWQTHYKLTLDLYTELAGAEFLNINYQRALELSKVILSQAVDVLDKVAAYEIILRTYYSTAQYQNGIEFGIEALEELKVNLLEELPENVDFDKLENLPEIQDEYQIAVLKVLVTFSGCAFMSDANLYRKIILTMADISMQYGHSGTAAYAYVACGFNSNGTGNIDLGYRYGLLSLQILDKFNDNRFYPKVKVIYYGLIAHWKQHIKFTLQPLLHTMYKAIEIGDLEYASIGSGYYCLNLIFGTETIDLIAAKMADKIIFLEKFNQLVSIYFIKILHQLILNLKGVNSHPCELNGQSFDENQMMPFIIDNKISILMFIVDFSKLILNYLFKRYTEAIEYALLAEKNTMTMVSSVTIPQHNFYYSLSLIANYVNVCSLQQEVYLNQIELNQAQMKDWAAHCPSNYQNKYELVEAEKSRILGKYWEAMQFYDAAIKNASENEFILELALAYELAGEFYLSQDKPKIAKLYLSDAYYAYKKWGANAKVKHLESQYPYLTTIISQPTCLLNSTKTNTTNITNITNITNTATTYKGASFDITTVVKAYQALSSEIVIDKLLFILMQLIRENAGAQKIYFLAVRQQDLYIEAVLDTDSDNAKVLQSRALTESHQLPVSLIYYVQRTRNYLLLDDGALEIWSKDTYIQKYQPLSALIFPVISKNELVGILYLENNLVKGAFTSNHIELLSIIAAQAAISLENARFYETLEQKVSERTQELRETQLKLIQSEKMSSLGQLVAGIAHEINNPINFIQGNITYTHESTQSLLDIVQKYQQDYPNSVINDENSFDLEFMQSDLPKAFMSMKNGVARVKDIVLSLRNFARLDEAEYKEADIHEGLDNTLMLLTPKLEKIQVIKEYSNLPQVFCFAGELNQVFMHLLNNAIDAVVNIKAPKIRIITELRNNQIAVVIADNGKGINPEIREKILDPFFTTKPVGQGTGLGLSISHQIIMQHSGQLFFTSQLGVGTEFTILLPYTKVVACS
ncbi:trifunctional serine/threonine-protein kinase/ATP-binding protein/sensor histidine kinase [Dulcicalothrix desertica]|nr:ATP-binding sensor histidine kinase [Dulcicalothrix desertica]